MAGPKFDGWVTQRAAGHAGEGQGGNDARGGTDQESARAARGAGEAGERGREREGGA